MRKAMRIQGWLALILVMLGLADPATAAEFDPFGLESTKLSREGLYTGAGAPDIGLTRDCNDNGDCWDVIRNGRGHTLERFGRDDSVAQLARARYKDRAFLLVDRAYDCGDDRCEEVVLYDQGGREVEVNKKFRKRFQDGGLDLFDLDEPLLLDLTVTKPGGLLALTSKGLVYMDREGKVQNRVQAPVRLTHGRIQNDLGGRQAAIGVGANNAVWLSNGKQWDAGGLRLAEHGDRKGVLSVQPEGDGSTVGAVYRYVNPYNKGLFLVRARPGEESPQSGPVLLSTV
ncbi:MAG TPA: hypothetical protein VKA48_01475, partial [Gammaproteobacteria bacterium]|nr:hypothetical protein [Gammaproteobacteria bacterium]